MLEFDYVEYGKLNVKADSTSGVPDWNDVLYTPRLQQHGVTLARMLEIQNSFYGEIGRFSFALLAANSNDLTFVAIQQRNEDEISVGGRSFHHMRFTDLKRQQIIEHFQNLHAVYSTLSRIFKIHDERNSYAKYEYRFPERKRLQQVDETLTSPDIAFQLEPEPVSDKNALFWMHNESWLDRIASWLLLLSQQSSLTITFPANDPNMRLHQRIQICDALQFLLSPYDKKQLITFALDPFTKRKTDIVFVETSSSNYRDINNGDAIKLIKAALNGYFAERGTMATGDYQNHIVASNNQVKRAYIRWKNTVSELLETDSTDETLLKFKSFKGLYTHAGLTDRLLALYSSHQAQWINIVGNVLHNINTWLYPEYNNNVKETIQQLLSDKKVSSNQQNIKNLVLLYWDILKIRKVSSNGLQIKSNKYFEILANLDQFELPEIANIIKENSFEFPIPDLLTEWKQYIIALIVKAKLPALEALEVRPNPWYEDYIKYLKMTNNARLPEIVTDPDEILEFARRQELSWYENRQAQNLLDLRELSIEKLNSDNSKVFFQASKVLVKRRAENISPISSEEKLRCLMEFSLDRVDFVDHTTLYELPGANHWDFFLEMGETVQKNEALQDAVIIHLSMLDSQKNSICEAVNNLNLGYDEITKFIKNNLLKTYLSKDKALNAADMEYIISNETEFSLIDFESVKRILPKTKPSIALFFKLFDFLTKYLTQSESQEYKLALDQYPLGEILPLMKNKSGIVVEELWQYLIDKNTNTGRDLVANVHNFPLKYQQLIFAKNKQLNDIKQYFDQKCYPLLDENFEFLVGKQEWTHNSDLILRILASKLKTQNITTWLNRFTGAKPEIVKFANYEQLMKLYQNELWLQDCRAAIFNRLLTTQDNDSGFLRTHIHKYPEDTKFLDGYQLEAILEIDATMENYRTEMIDSLIAKGRTEAVYSKYKNNPSYKVFVAELKRKDPSVDPFALIWAALREYRSVLLVVLFGLMIVIAGLYYMLNIATST